MQRKICIAFIIGGLRLGGAEQQLYHVLAGLDRSRFRPVVITLGSELNEFWHEPIARLGISVFHLPRKLGRFFRTLKIRAILRAEKAKIVHSWSFYTNPYSALTGRLAGTPLRFGSMRENYDLLADTKLIRCIGYWGLDIIITNSVSATKQVEELKLTKGRVCTLLNGVSIPAPITQTERNNRRAELGCSSQNLLIGTIGRLDKNKNHRMLLQVFAQLLKDRPCIDLAIIGEGPLKCQLQALAEELGIAARVRLTGAIPFASRFLPVMDVCCMTSYTEGMPNLIMEASAAGIPVVSTRCGDSARLIHHGLTGFVVSPEDNLAMIAYLHQLLGDLECRVRMGQCRSGENAT